MFGGTWSEPLQLTLFRGPAYVLMIAAPLLLIDNLSPAVREEVTVVGQEHTLTPPEEPRRHKSQHQRRLERERNRWVSLDGTQTLPRHIDRSEKENWTLQFDGSVIGRCDVDEATWSKISPGDVLEVSATRFTHRCTRIERDGVKLWSNWFNGLLTLLGGIFMVGFTFMRRR